MKPGIPEGAVPGKAKKTREPREDFGERVKAHQAYTAADGVKVPSVTAIIGVMDKPYLVGWANRLGLDGIVSHKYTGASARVGTLSHDMIEADLMGKEANTYEYSQDEIDRATHSLNAFRRWKAGRVLVPKYIEEPLVSEEHRYGGKIDFYGDEDGVPGLDDFKTSPRINLEHKIQATAYTKLLLERGETVKRVKIIRVGRRESTTVAEEEELRPADMKLYWRIFLACLEIYNLKKELGEK